MEIRGFYVRGRLVITALGAGRFTVEVTRGADEWAIARNDQPADLPPQSGAGSHEATMNELSPEPTRQALHPAMPQKLPLRATEVAMGWTRGRPPRWARSPPWARLIGVGVAGTIAYLLYREAWSAIVTTRSSAPGAWSPSSPSSIWPPCPRRVEATFFALPMAVFDGGPQSAQVVGGHLYDWLAGATQP